MRGIKHKKSESNVTWYKRLNPFSVALLILFFAVLAVWFPRSTFYTERRDNIVYLVNEALLSAGLRLEEIFVHGRVRTSQKELLNALGASRGMPINVIDIQTSREKIQRLPWVKNVHIERRLPHFLYVSIEERKPVAVWQNNGKYSPIDSQGQLVETSVHRLNGLPLIVGPEAPEKTPELLDFLAQEPDLLARVKAASHIGKRRWNIILDDLNNGITVRLPEKDPATAWGRLARLERTQGILKRKITLIDLRLPDKLTVRLEEESKNTKKNSSSKKTSSN